MAVKKISLGGIATKREDTKTAYPTLDTPEARQLSAQIVEQTAEVDSLTGSLEAAKAELRDQCASFYFRVNHGKHEVPSSVSVPSDKGETLVSFANRYSKLDADDAVRKLLGDAVTEKFFAQSFAITIKGENLPADPVVAQELIAELQTLFVKYNALGALEAKEGIKPTKDFHAARHTALTVEQNLALQDVCPIVAMCKTKGRK